MTVDKDQDETTIILKPEAWIVPWMTNKEPFKFEGRLFIMVLLEFISPSGKENTYKLYAGSARMVSSFCSHSD